MVPAVVVAVERPAAVADRCPAASQGDVLGLKEGTDAVGGQIDRRQLALRRDAVGVRGRPIAACESCAASQTVRNGCLSLRSRPTGGDDQRH